MVNLYLELNINSASNLVNVNFMTKMDVFTVIKIHGDNTKKQKAKTTVDRSGGSNPKWNDAVNFSINERLAREGRLKLIMRLISRGVLVDKEIGRVKVPIVELLNSIMPSISNNGNDNEMKSMVYQVRTKSGKRSGSLNFSYLFKPSSHPWPSIEPPLSAPQEWSFEFPKVSQYHNNSDHQKHPFAPGSSNEPLPVSRGDVMMEQPNLGLSPYDKSGHAPPPPSLQGYGQYDYAPRSLPGYGYGSPSYQHQNEVGFGLGLGAGLVGGLMTGDIISDVVKYLAI